MWRLRQLGPLAILPAIIAVLAALGLVMNWLSRRQAAAALPQAKLQQAVTAEVYKLGGSLSHGIGVPARFFENEVPPAIDAVDLSNKAADGKLLKQLCQLVTIQRLTLDGTNIQPGEFKELSRLTSLQSLSLARTRVTDADLAVLSQLSALRTLSLRETSVGDEGMKQLAGRPTLHSLDVSQTRLTADGLRILSAIPALHTITLDESCITRESVLDLKKSKNLKLVEVRVSNDLGKQSRELLLGQLSAQVFGMNQYGERMWESGAPWEETVAGAIDAVRAQVPLDSRQTARLIEILNDGTFGERPYVRNFTPRPQEPMGEEIRSLDEFIRALRASNRVTQSIRDYVQDTFTKEDVPRLLQVLQAPENTGGILSWCGLSLLVHFGLDDPEVVREIDRLLAHDDPMVRTRTCDALSRSLPFDVDWISGDKIAEFCVPRLVHCCGDEAEMVRYSASNVLAKVVTEHPKHAPDAMAAFIKMIQLGPFYSRESIHQIAELNKDAVIAVVPELRRMLQDKAIEVPAIYLKPTTYGLKEPLSLDEARASYRSALRGALWAIVSVDPALANEFAVEHVDRIRRGEAGGIHFSAPFPANSDAIRTVIVGLLDIPEYKYRGGVRASLVSAVQAICDAPPEFTVQLDVVRQQLDAGFCWFHPRVAAVPGMGKDGKPLIVLTMQKHLAADDHYSGLNYMTTDDLGTTWTDPKAPPELDWRPGDNNETIAVCDVTPGWHPQTRKVIAIGTILRYSQAGAQLLDMPRSYDFAYAVYDPQADSWTTWQRLDMPMGQGDRFHQVAPGCVQWLVNSDGTLLIPVCFQGPQGGPYSVTVVHATFDGTSLKYASHSEELRLNDVRGLVEPSLAFFKDRYYLTLRNDNRGYVTVSHDGQTFAPIKPWKFDDGSELGSYNTQQHWVVHDDGLFLVYTRRGANNDHITRHRAPLFMGRVSPTSLRVIRQTEQELIPERGVMLGNFGAAVIDENETWVTDSEFITAGKAHPRGANGSTFAARIQWSKPNR